MSGCGCRNNRGQSSRRNYAGGRDWTAQEIQAYLDQGLITPERAQELFAAPLAKDRGVAAPTPSPWKAAAAIAGLAGLAAILTKKD